jgi:hypothetical protein
LQCECVVVLSGCRDPTDIKIYRWDGKALDTKECKTDELDSKMQDRDHYPLRLVATELTTQSMVVFPRDGDLLYAVSATNHVLASRRALHQGLLRTPDSSNSQQAQAPVLRKQPLQARHSVRPLQAAIACMYMYQFVAYCDDQDD